MVSNENNEEMSVNDILSSIKEVISSEQDLKKSANDDNFIELTDVVDEEAPSDEHATEEVVADEAPAEEPAAEEAKAEK